MKYFLSLLAIFIFVGLSLAQTKASKSVPKPVPTPLTIKERPNEIVVSDIPKETWEPIFHKSIERAGRSVGIKPLRKATIADSDIEIRIWAGFGIAWLQGFVLKRRGSDWSAFYIGIPVAGSGRENTKTKLARPKSGWESTWDLMLENGVLTLPDARAIKCNAMYEDGHSYVVEIMKGKNYRTYMFDNPSEKFDNRCAEADKILAIAEIVATEYGVTGFR